LSSALVIVIVIGFVLKFSSSGSYTLKLSIIKYFDIPVVLLLVTAAISTAFSINIYVSTWGPYLRHIGFLDYIFLCIIYFLAGHVYNASGLNKFINAMVICGSIVSLYAFMQDFQIDPFMLHLNAVTRPGSTLGYPVFLSGFLILIFPFTLRPFFQKRPADIKYYINYLPALLLFVTLIISKTRTVYIGLILQLLIAAVFFPYLYNENYTQFKKLRKIGLVFAALLIISVIALLTLSPGNAFVNRFLSIFYAGDNPRLYVWVDSLKIIKSYFFTGTGIGNFSRAFEEIVSQKTILSDLKGFFDNAHSNYIHIFCTMGILGLGAYLYLIFSNVFISLKSSVSKELNKDSKTFNLIFFCALAGYIIYGIADFDDLCIMLYLILILSMIKYTNAGLFKPKLIAIKFSGAIKFLIYILSLVIILGSAYIIYKTVLELYADRYENLAKDFYAQGNYMASFNEFRGAVNLQNGCSEYRYNLATYLYDYCMRNPNIPVKSRISMLMQAKDEIEKSAINAPLIKKCRSVLSLIYYELGEQKQADEIKNELLSKDSAMVFYRLSLARMYLKNKDYNNAIENLNTVTYYDRDNIEAYLLHTMYYEEAGDINKALENVRKILTIDKNYPGAKKWEQELEQKRKK
jgi:putative inorganic carbon (HCO3(-)) transporter